MSDVMEKEVVDVLSFQSHIAALLNHLMTFDGADVRFCMNACIVHPRPFVKVQVFAEGDDPKEAQTVILWEKSGGSVNYFINMQVLADGHVVVQKFGPEKAPPFLWTEDPMTPAAILALWKEDDFPLLRIGFALLFGL